MMDERDRVQCPVCGRWLLRQGNGLMRRHGTRIGWPPENCPGVGMIVSEAPIKNGETT